jgi:hypothetical protein
MLTSRKDAIQVFITGQFETAVLGTLREFNFATDKVQRGRGHGFPLIWTQIIPTQLLRGIDANPAADSQAKIDNFIRIFKERHPTQSMQIRYYSFDYGESV